MNQPVDAVYAAWVARVHQLGGVATAWPFPGESYGRPAARFPSTRFAELANAGTLPMANGVQFNNPGTWVYVLAAAMTGNNSVDNSIDASTNATDAEAEAACAVNGNCPGDTFQEIEKILRDVAIAAGVAVAASVLLRIIPRRS